MIGIYKITNKVTGKIYIGQSKQIEKRFKEHIRHSRLNTRNARTPLHSDIKRYGSDNFAFEVLEECEMSLLSEREKFYIAKYNSTNPEIGYNITKGGIGGPIMFAFDNPKSVLSEAVVCEINSLYLKGLLKRQAYRIIFDKYGINKNTFTDVWSGKTYKTIVNRSNANKDHIKEMRRINMSKETDTFSKVYVREIRDMKNKGVPYIEVYGIYKDILNKNTFRDIWYNRTYKYIKSDIPDNSAKSKNVRKSLYKIAQYSLGGELLNTFSSIREAYTSLFDNYTKTKASPIRACCLKKQKTAFGYKWEYVI